MFLTLFQSPRSCFTRVLKLGRVNHQGNSESAGAGNARWLTHNLRSSGRAFFLLWVFPKPAVGGNAPPILRLRLQRFVGKKFRGICKVTQRGLPERTRFAKDVEEKPITKMKRPCEDTSSDSDMDETIDVGSENNYSGQSSGSFIRCSSPTTTSQVMARKKRRGIIEKRRRDRINNSLCELRRLVPTAFEKQGSAKLEKAEILQMTVDHLKMLQATGGKAGYFDAHALAMDFMSIGFRECLTEVARYLSSVEGLESGDPLRVRLVSHLSTCASQREAAAMTSSMAHHHHHHHPQALHPHHWAAAAAAAALHPLPAAFLQNGLPPSPSEAASARLSEVPPRGSALLTASSFSSTSSSSSSSSAASSSSSSSSASHSDTTLRAPSTGSVAPCVPPQISTSLLSLSATVHAAAAAAAAQTFPLSFPGGFPLFTPSLTATASSSSGGLAAAAQAHSPSISTSTSASQHTSSGGGGSNSSGSASKPYRPWGTEVGAF
ncbi:hypothetical protein ACEWY4_021749 [Coilia grayii]|uniref:Hairy/enhancer-of-split related with YRPW motif protein 2 n=1 Tax=Coilia grayii TaxID=363190 RepID=A0ABD1J5M0_9TELE